MEPSKQFTAPAVMLLVEAGRLDLREPVARWLPDGLPQWRRVTLHHPGLLPPDDERFGTVASRG